VRGGALSFGTTQLRTFLAAVEHQHFGDTAAELGVSQQAVSKRILRLEAIVGAPLFLRRPWGVELTDAGHRLLPQARQLVAAADAALEATRAASGQRALRVDVWGSFFGPMRRLARIARRAPDLELAISERWNLDSSLRALQRHEIDVAFGRVDRSAGAWPDTLAHRPILFEPIAVAVSDHHPLAAATDLHPAQLRPWGLWWPVGDEPAEMVDYARQLGTAFEIDVDTHRYQAATATPIKTLLRDRTKVLAWGLGWPIAETGAHTIPLEPTPLYPWSMIWRSGDTHPLLPALHQHLTTVGDQQGWLAFDPRRHWLPAADQAERRRAQPVGIGTR
jgi:DNA-binding transcriptional LysR family regulator